MRNFADITEEEVKALYDETPEVNHFFTWEQVKEFEPMYVILKNKIIAHEQEQDMEKQPNNRPVFLAIDNGERKPQTAISAAPEVRTVRHQNQAQLPPIKRSTITLKESQVNQLNTALRLARNCLQCEMGEQVKNEALEELARSQATIGEFFKPR